MNSIKSIFFVKIVSAPLLLCTVLLNNPVLAADPAIFDVDGNGDKDALTDGILTLRHLFGFTGDSLISSAVGSGASRNSASAITSYLNSHTMDFDADGNNITEPLTDGLLFLRYLFGFSGDSLITGAIGANASRDSAGAIIKHFRGFCPTFYVDTPSTSRCTSRGLATYSFIGNESGTGTISVAPTVLCPGTNPTTASDNLTYTLANIVTNANCEVTADMTANALFTSDTRSVSIVDGIVTY